ncbi:MAG: cytochrome c4 [Chromatiales bacterium]|nr:cytochrome c4 [Chromatiales bacterium]
MKYKICLMVLSFLAMSVVGAQGDIEQGKSKSMQCVACHGPDGNSVNPQWPKIAGQSAQYIIKQLQHFKKSERVNPLMNPQAAALSDDDIKHLAAYYESMVRSPGAADEALVAAGEKLYRGGNSESGIPACISCHGPNGKGNPAAGFPNISYQHAMYTVERLKKYRSATENYPGSEIMNGIAAKLTDDEIEAVSSYMQGLH